MEQDEIRAERATTTPATGVPLKRLVSWLFSKKVKITSIHFYAERDFPGGSSFQEGCIDLAGSALTVQSVEYLRDFIDSQFANSNPERIWTSRSKIKSITILES